MVEAFKIIGGKKIAGELKVDGSKNSTLPIMIATLVEKGTYSREIGRASCRERV